MQSDAAHVVIVGGGISGLTTAWRLQQQARAACGPVDITILERRESTGGKLITEQVDGYTVEHGPDIFLARKPWAVNLCRDLGLENELQPTNPDLRGSFIQRRGRLHPLPSGFSGLVPTELGPLLRTPLLSWAGKARLAMEGFVPKRRESGDEALGAFIRRRLGREAYERLVHPLLSGIYGGDIDTISLRATFPQFHELEQEHGSLVRGMLQQRRSSTAEGPAFVTLRGGMATLPRHLSEKVGADVRTGSTASSVERAPGDLFGSMWTVRVTGTRSRPTIRRC